VNVRPDRCNASVTHDDGLIFVHVDAIEDADVAHGKARCRAAGQRGISRIIRLRKRKEEHADGGDR
jgi:hypothetical protein